MPDSTTCTCDAQTIVVLPDPDAAGYARVVVSCFHVATGETPWRVTYGRLTAPEAMDVIGVYVGYNEHRHADADHAPLVLSKT